MVGAGGRLVGAKLAQWARTVDPDVARHISQWPLLSYSLFASKNNRVSRGKPDGHPPLIFVHGLGGNRGNFLLMALYLRVYGRKRNYRIFFDPKQTVERRAARLARFIDRVVEVTGEPKVDIVSHSLGGLFVRLALANPSTAAKVLTVVTLGAPHAGTYAARYAGTPTLRQLRTDSALISRLKTIPWPIGVRGFTCWSKNDLFIIPPESARLEGTRGIDLTPFTHYSYLIDPKAWATVRRALAA